MVLLNGLRAIIIAALSVNTIRAVDLRAVRSANICPIRAINRGLGQAIWGKRVDSAVVGYEVVLLEIVICIVYDDVCVSATKTE